jgi:phosphoglucomutase
VPEKDGLLACLLVAELVAHRRASLRQLMEELTDEVGIFLSRRIDLHLKPAERERLLSRLEEPPSQLLDRRIVAVQRVDGTKLIFADDSWVLIRLSGTEPVARVYVEARSPADLERLIEAGREIVTGS